MEITKLNCIFMNKEQSLLLSLIKKSQFGSLDCLYYGDQDIESLANEALYQSVIGIVASVLFEIPNFSNDHWKQLYNQVIANNIRYYHTQDELVNLLKHYEIPYIILKGSSAAIYYEKPTCRMMGDIDVLVQQSYYDKAKVILSDNGYNQEHDDGRNTKFHKNGITIELHHHFSADVDIEAYLIDGIINSVNTSIDDHSFYMLPKLANGLVLLDHFRWHLRSGVGLRQVIDWMMFVYHNLDDDFWSNEFQVVVKEKGMEKLAITTTRMCQKYLGLSDSISWCNTADERDCDQLMECIISSGNFGQKNGLGNSIEKVSTKFRREGFFHWLQEAGEFNWKAYHKHHCLKPFCWLYQMFRYINQGMKTGRNSKQLKNDFERSKERYELLKKLGVE